jgi:hypothetical protein
MKITKKHIRENTKTSKVCDYKNIFVHEYKDLSVRTYRFGNRPPDHVERRDGFGLRTAANKEEFVDVCYDYYSNLKPTQQ